MTSERLIADVTELPKKFLSLEAGRFVAAFAVVLFHVGVTTAQPKYFGYYALPALAGGFSGVEFFFVLSGFVIVGAHYSDFRSPDTGFATISFLWKRFVRLYPALWAILIVLVPGILLVRGLQWNGPISFADIVSAFAITPFPVERILSVEWTLRYEALFYAVIALLLWRRALGIVGFAAMIALSVASYVINAKGIAAFFISPYPLLFLAGMAIAYVARNFALRYAVSSLVVGFAVLIWRLSVCAAHPEHNGVTFWDTSFFGLAAALIIYGLVAREARQPMAVPTWLQYLGKASYAIYLVHFPIVSIGAKLAMKLRPHVPDLILMMLAAILAVIGGVVYHELVEKQVIRLARRFQPKMLDRDKSKWNARAVAAD